MFDCVISDLMMPKIDGMELLKRIRMQDSQVCFLMITGFPNIDSAVNAIKEGAYDYVRPLHNICFCLCEEATADEAIS